MSVYLARFGISGPVKIGTSLNVPRRLDQIGAKLWDDMRLLRLLEGTATDERVLHNKFAAQRIRLEWFHFHPAMLGDLGLPDLAAFPERALTAFAPRQPATLSEAKVSAALRAWMTARGLSERDVAALAKVSPGTVGEWLRYGAAPRRGATAKLLQLGDNEGLGDVLRQHRSERAAERRQYAAMARRDETITPATTA